MPIVLYGVRGYTLPAGSGDFFCPGCIDSVSYRKKLSFAAVHLYFIPIIPFKWQTYIECGACLGTFDKGVLEWDPRHDPAMKSASQQAMLETMAMMMIADGDIDEREVEVIQGIYQQIAGRPLDREELVATAQRFGPNTELTFVLGQVRTSMNAEGREQVFRAALHVALADEVLTDEERELLDRIAHTLMISRDRAAWIWDEVTRPPQLTA